MQDNGFMFGDLATWDFPILRVEQYPQIPTPVRRTETYTIPGRSGVLHSTEEAFDPIEKSYSCYFHADKNVSATAMAIKAWLLADDGPQRLIDPYDLEHWFRATVAGGIQFENWMGNYSRFVVTFSCDPRAFRRDGEEPRPLRTSGGAFYNPCAYACQPLIYVYGSGNGSLTIGDRVVTITNMDTDLILDCEDMNAYRLISGVEVSRNDRISAPEFPVLRPGNNPVKWTGGITGVDIVPRWFDL